MKYQAFTLIEMLVVLMLIGVVLAFSMPNFRMIDKNMALIESREVLMQDLRVLRIQAQSEQAIGKLQLGKDSYELILEFSNKASTTLQKRQLPNGISLHETSNSGTPICFLSDGTCLKYSTLTLKNGKKETRVIIADTGRVRVEDR